MPTDCRFRVEAIPRSDGAMIRRTSRGSSMKWQEIEHRWPELKPRVRRHWFHLTQDDVDAIGGTREERSEEHTSELQSLAYLVCRLLLEKKKKKINNTIDRGMKRSRSQD